MENGSAPLHRRWMETGDPSHADALLMITGGTAALWVAVGLIWTAATVVTFGRRVRFRAWGAAAAAWLRRAPGWVRDRRERIAEWVAWPISIGLFFLALYLVVRSVAVSLGSEAAWLGLDGVKDKWVEIRNGLLIGAAALGAPFVLWRALLATKQTAIQQETHFTDLYAKAVEMLGADKTVKSFAMRDEFPEPVETTEPNIEVRLGAIYALERIAAQSDRDYRPIIETLCAYVRQNVGEPEENDDAEDPPEQQEDLAYRIDRLGRRTEKLRVWGNALRTRASQRSAKSAARPDIAAALAALMRRGVDQRRYEGWAVTDPPILALPLKPSSYTVSDQERRVRADTQKKEIRATETHSEMPAPWRLDMYRAVLQGIVWSDADMRRWNLTEARMEGAKLREARIEGARLRRARLTGADLNLAYLNACKADGCYFDAAEANQARFVQSDLVWARFRGTSLIYSYLDFSDLRCALFIDALCTGASFHSVNLFNAEFSGASLSEADFTGACIASVDFRAARGLTDSQIAQALGDYQTALPDDVELQRPAHWHAEKLVEREANADWRRWLAAGCPKEADWRERA